VLRTLPLVPFAVFLALLSPGSAAAHEPFEITTDARLHADRLNVRITMAASTAAKACLVQNDPKSPPPRIAAAEFDALRTQLETCAAGLYEITAGGVAMRARDARASLSVENDVELELVYPAPTRSPLRFDAVLLKRLPDPTYGAQLTVTGEGTFLGQQLLRADASTLEIAIATRAHGKPDTGRVTPARPWWGERLWLELKRIFSE
jgi:hypothetical protein